MITAKTETVNGTLAEEESISEPKMARPLRADADDCVTAFRANFPENRRSDSVRGTRFYDNPIPLSHGLRARPTNRRWYRYYTTADKRIVQERKLRRQFGDGPKPFSRLESRRVVPARQRSASSRVPPRVLHGAVFDTAALTGSSVGDLWTTVRSGRRGIVSG